jgi:hypothetical protein
MRGLQYDWDLIIAFRHDPVRAFCMHYFLWPCLVTMQVVNDKLFVSGRKVGFKTAVVRRSECRNELDDERMKSCLRDAASHNPDTENLLAEEQCQPHCCYPVLQNKTVRSKSMYSVY